MLARAHRKFQRGQHSEIYLLTLKKQDKTKMELPLDMVSISAFSCRTNNVLILTRPKGLLLIQLLPFKRMISNTKDIWRLKSKWSDHDRFWTDHDRKLAEVSSDFFSISLAPTNIVVRVHTKNYGKTRKTKGIYRKTRKPLRTREVYANEHST